MTIRIATVSALIWLTAAASALAQDAPWFAGPGRGVSVLRDPVGTIDVETYVPAACAAKPCPLVISMHGLTRNAGAARDNWVEPAERYGLLVAAPHFDKERFPTRFYQQGGVRDEPDPARWLYATIERLFDAARAGGRVAGEGYTLFGHSAGAQVVHRMALLMPQARFQAAVTANAGYYTLPVGREAAGGFSYPYSLAGAPVTEAGLKAAFARPLVIMLGDKDDDPDHFQLNKSKGAEAQGPTRLARGRHFAAVAAAEASRLGVASRWREIIVPGVAHEQTKMAHAAAEALFGR